MIIPTHVPHTVTDMHTDSFEGFNVDKAVVYEGHLKYRKLTS